MSKILIIEDDPTNRELLERLLMLYGYDVVSTGDGAKGVALASSLQPNLIIMDMGLPVLNGWQATHRLKSMLETRHIPIIALTAYAMFGDRARCLAVGCDDYATKPIEVGRLMAQIASLLGRPVDTSAPTPT
jgi:two-component system, cell cycle response regulator DivK